MGLSDAPRCTRRVTAGRSPVRASRATEEAPCLTTSSLHATDPTGPRPSVVPRGVALHQGQSGPSRLPTPRSPREGSAGLLGVAI
ncbi:hypothetical protein NDU88_001427 [Pleurodeles waltl]|uniref:Uncharacterized protein n=1 Tax=Pleurodeles waltl TaxID=8319 RepID=A0AAV7W0G3_PLEWA|nr:hypothetical protein NDU88_001427 [Pleurodeles waltl]